MQVDIEKIFDLWCDLRVAIGKRRPCITKKRKKLLEKSIKEFGLDEIELVILYLKDSKDDYAVFIRTEKSGKYTSLETILRETKFEDKLERAKDWEFDKKKKAKLSECHLPYTIVFGDK